MDTPLYHHLLVLNDWQIDHNELFLTEEEVEPALRRAVKDNAERWNYSDEVVEEILAAEDLDDLRSALEDHDVSIYVSTIEAPATPPAPDMTAEEYNTVMVALLDHSGRDAIFVADSLRKKFGKHAPQR